MTNYIRIFSLLTTLVSSIAFAATPTAEEKAAWPKGINPATLLVNTDSEPEITSSDFTSLYNGKDLTGWSVKGGKMLFEAQGDEIVGTNVLDEPNGFLCTDKIYTDFIFTAEFKWEVLGNSGFMFRADTRPAPDSTDEHVFGYQSEMDDQERRWTGGIYGEKMNGWIYPLSKIEGHQAARAAIQDHRTWNRVTILAQGEVIKTWINGIPCAHSIDNLRSEGFFGLQIHSGPKGTVHWRNIKVKEL